MPRILEACMPRILGAHGPVGAACHGAEALVTHVAVIHGVPHAVHVFRLSVWRAEVARALPPGLGDQVGALAEQVVVLQARAPGGPGLGEGQDGED